MNIRVLGINCIHGNLRNVFGGKIGNDNLTSMYDYKETSIRGKQTARQKNINFLLKVVDKRTT